MPVVPDDGTPSPGHVKKLSLLARRGLTKGVPRSKVAGARSGSAPGAGKSGTGPKGDGRLFRIKYTGKTLPQPVWAWAAAPDEFRIAFEKELKPEDATRLRNLVKLIEGFSSELSLEILATTDFILQQHPAYSLDEVMTAIGNWNSRKNELFKKEYVVIAYNHLQHYRNTIG